MGYWRNYIDISSCMLFEATGDSEIDSDLSCTAIINDNMGTIASSSSDPAEDIRMAGLAEDDAFSCSCDVEYCSNDFDRPAEQDCVWADDGDEEEDEDERGRKLMDDHDPHRREYCKEEDEDAVDQVPNDRDRVYNNNTKAGGVNNVLKRLMNSDQPGPAAGGGGGVGVVMNMMGAEAGRRKKKLKVCGKREFINQRDEDRHFWEACLSS